VSGARPQRKGATGEREIVTIGHRYDFPVRRNFASGAQGGGDLVGLPDEAEVKRVSPKGLSRLIGFVKQSMQLGKRWVLFLRIDGMEGLAVLPTERYFELIYKERSSEQAIRTDEA